MSSAPALEPTTDPVSPGAGVTVAPPPDPSGQAGPAAPFVPGEVVGERYLLLDQIGRGTSCAVWRARDEILRRDVAIKRLLGNPAWSPVQADAARRRAEREGRVAARLHHPRVAAIYDLIEIDGDVALVMELVDAPPLSTLVRTRGPLDPAATARIGTQIAEGLAAAHAAGVLHRDVKPANVLVDADGAATLTDFGVARLVDDASTTTAAGGLTGTPHFMAPEVARGGLAGPEADVYALGATLYFAVEGQPPTGDGPTALETLRRVAAGQVLPMHRAGPLAPALARLLDADPAARPAAVDVPALLRSAVGTPGPVPERLGALVSHPAPAHPATLIGRPLPDPRPDPRSASRPDLRPTAVPPLRAAIAAGGSPRARRVAVWSLLGVAGVAGAVGGALAVTHADSTPLAAAGAAAVPHVDAPVVPPAVPVSAPPITPAPEAPITDLGPTVEPPAPALVVQADMAPTMSPASADDGSDSGRHHRSADDGDHQRDDKGDGGKKKHRDHDDRGHGKHRSHSDDDSGDSGDRDKHRDSDDD